MNTQGYTGALGPYSTGDDYALLRFVIESLAGQNCTIELVQVKKVTGGGPNAGPPTVDVQPMVHQVDGEGQIVPHGTLYSVPAFRLQGGSKAVILDPVVGDIGACLFAARDISVVKATAAPAAPGSKRKFNWADGLYLGAFLGSAPTRYLWLSDSGAVLHDPTKITLDTPDCQVTGNLHSPGTITGDTDVIASGKSGKSHVHGGVQSGGSSTNPPT